MNYETWKNTAVFESDDDAKRWLWTQWRDTDLKLRNTLPQDGGNNA